MARRLVCPGCNLALVVSDPAPGPTICPRCRRPVPPAARGRSFLGLALVGVAWLVAAVAWGIWAYRVFFRALGDRWTKYHTGQPPEDATPKVLAAVAGVALLVVLLSWVLFAVRHLRSRGR